MPKRSRVLLVEDDARQCAMTELLLCRGGYEVRTVGSVPHAVGALDDGFDLLITDIDLGDGDDGLVLAAYARSSHPALPILVTSARVPARFEEMRLSTALYLRKPFTAKALLDVAHLLTGSRRDASV